MTDDRKSHRAAVEAGYASLPEYVERNTPAAHTPIPMAAGYFADWSGAIYSASGWRGHQYRKLVSNLNSHGYPSVRVMVNGSRKRFAVHRLVASAFLPPRPTPAHEIRHLDGDKLNCIAANLAWGTRADNAADREMHGRTSRGIRHSAAIKRGLEAA